MTPDLATLSLAQTIVVTTCGVAFILDTALRRNDLTGRLWSLAFIAGILTTFAYVLWSVDRDAWWAVAVGNGAIVVAIGAMYSGIRSLNGRAPRLVGVLLAGAGTMLATLAFGENGGDWAGAPVMFAGIAAFSASGAVETLRGRLANSVNARFLGFVLAFVGCFYLLRIVLFFAATPESTVWQQVGGYVPTTIVTIILMVVASITVTSLRASDRRGDPRDGDLRGLDEEGMLDEKSFRVLAEDRLSRADFHQEDVVVLSAELDGLAELNTAFGRSAGDRAIAAFGAVLRRHAPVDALIARRGGGRFLLLFGGSRLDSVETLRAVQDALVDDPVDEEHGMRSTGSFGVSHTEHTGYDLDELVSGATAAARHASADGGNRIVGRDLPLV